MVEGHRPFLHRSIPLAISLGLCTLFSACGSPAAPPVEGTLKIVTRTSGASLDADGYVVEVAALGGEPIAINASTSRALLPSNGGYTVALSGIAPNCTLAGPNPRDVPVEPDATTPTTFFVGCAYVPRAIAFTRDGDIYATDTDAAYPVRLTDSEAAEEAPSWSPDGTRIAFVRNGELFTMDADGSDATYVTGTDDDAIFDIVWSPDGSRVMYSTSLWTDDGWCPDDATWIVDLEGSAPILISLGHGTGWSPDGLQVAVSHSSDPSDACSPSDIHLVEVDGSSKPTVLLDGPGSEGDAVWSPDGSRIAFVIESEGDTDIYTMNPDGSDVARLTTETSWDGEPAWSPDGAQIAFLSNRDGNFDVWLMDADGSNPLSLTNHPGADGPPSWAPVTFDPSSANQR